MSSYISKKQKVFGDGVGQAGDLGLCRRRSDGRMKNFGSCTDTRAWCIQDEERRQYILDLIQGPTKKGLCLGKYIPIEVLIDVLLASKTADLLRLQKKVDELQKLLDIYCKLDLTEEQKRQLKLMKEKMQESADELSSLASDGTSQGVSDSKGTTTKESLAGSDTGDELEMVDEEAPRYCAAGGGGLVKKKKSNLPAAQSAVSVKKDPASSNADKTVSFVPSTKPSKVLDYSTASTVLASESMAKTDSYSNMDKDNLRNTIIEKDEEIKQLKAIATAAIDKLENLKVIMEEKNQLKKQLTHSQLKLASAQSEKALLAKAVVSSRVPGIDELEAQINKLKESGNLTPEQETEMIKKELLLLKKYCDELSNIQEENENLKRQCDFLKRELKQTGPRPMEEEVEIEVLRRSFDQQLNQSSKHIQYLESKLSTARNEVLQSEDVVTMQKRASMLEDVIEQRDDLQHRLNKLQGMEDQLRRVRKRADEAEMLEREKEYLLAEIGELQKYKRQSDYQITDIQSLKMDKDSVNRSLESIRTERDELKRKVAELENVQDAFNKLQQENSQFQSVVSERDMLRMKVKEYEHVNEELERLRFKAKESDVLRLERDRLQVRIEELSALEVEVLTLVEQVKNVSIERDMAKRRTCEMQCIIADQEDEIKALACHVDRLSKNIDNHQEKIITAISGMRMELEKKNSKIASSEERLQQMDNIKNGMVEMEEQLRSTIQELTKELKEKQNLIDSLQSKLADTKTASSLEAVKKMTGELKLAQKENEQLQNMINKLGRICSEDHVAKLLTESKQAVGVVIREMRQYMDGQQMNDVMNYMQDDLIAENKQLRRQSVDLQSLAQTQMEDLMRQLNQAIQDNAELKAENELLQSMTKGIENDLKKINSQLEENLTSSDNVSELKQQLDTVQREKDELEGVIGQLRQQLAKETPDERVAELEQQLATEKAHSKGLEQSLEAEANQVNALTQRLEVLNNENNTLKDRMEERNEVVQKLSTEMEQIPQTIEVLSSVSQQFREENESLKVENARLADELRLLQSALQTDDLPGEAALKEHIAKLQSELLNLKEPDNDMMALKAINKELENQVEHLKNEIDRLADFLPIDVVPNKEPSSKGPLKDEVDDYRREIRRLSSIELDVEDNEASPESLRARNKELVAQIKALKQQIRLLEDRVPTLDANNVTEQDYASKVTAQMAQMKNIIDQQEAEIEELKRKITGLTNSLRDTGSEGHVGNLMRTIGKLESDIGDLQCENNCLRKCLLSTSPSDENAAFSEMNLMSANKKLRAELDDMKEEMECIRNCDAFKSMDSGADEVKTLRRKNEELEDEVRILQEQLASLKQIRQEPGLDIEDLDAETDVQKLKDKIGELNEINRSLRVRIAELEATLNGVERRERPNDDIINELKAKIMDLESGGLAKDGTTASTSKRIQELEARIKELEEENAHLKERIAGMKKEQNDLMDQLQSKIRRGSIQETELESDLRKYRTKVAELEDMNDELKATIESLKSKLADSTNNRIKELEDKVAELEEAKKNLENRIANFSKEQNELADKLAQRTRRSSVQESEFESEIMKLRAKIKELESENKDLQDQLAVGKRNLANVSETERRKSVTLEDQIATLSTQNNILKKENELLTKEVNDLKQKLDTLARESVPELENDIAKLRKQMETLKDADKDNEELRKQLADLKKQIDSLKDDVKEKEKQIVDLKEATKDNDDLKKQIDSLRNDVKEKEKQIADLKESTKDNDNLKKQIDSLKDDIKEREKQIADLKEATKDNDELKKQINSLKNDVTEKEKQIDSLKNTNKENDDLKKQVASLKDATKEADQLKKEIDTLKEVSKEADDLRKQIDKLKEVNKENDDLKKQIAGLKEANKQIDELTKQIDDLKKVIDDLKKQIDGLKESNKQIDELKKQLEKLTGADDDNTNLRKQVESLKQEINALKTELSQKGDTGLQDEVDKLKKDNESLQQKLDAAQKDISAERAKLQQKVDELTKNAAKGEKSEQENESLKKEIEGLKQKVTDQTTGDNKRVGELENENSNLKAEIKDLKDKINKLEKDNREHKTDVSEVPDPTEMDALKREISTLKSGNTALEKQNTELKKEVENLKNKISALEKASDQQGTAELVNENVTLKQDIAGLQQKIKDLEQAKGAPVAHGDEGQRISALEKEIETLKKQKSSLENDKSNLQKEIESLKQKIKDLEKELGPLKAEKGQLDALQKQQPDSGDQLRALQADNEKLRKEKGMPTTADSSDLLKDLQNENDRLKKEAARQSEELNKMLSMTDSGDMLKALKEENDRLKQEHELDRKKMEDEYKKNLALAKEQYDTDVKFVRGRHSDSIDKLQNLHEESLGEVNKEYEKEIDNLQKLLAEERKQCKEMLTSLEDKLDKCKKQLEEQRGDRKESVGAEGVQPASERPATRTCPCGTPIPRSSARNKICPCGAKIREASPTPPLKQATALVAKVHYDGSQALTIALTKKTIVMTSIEPGQSPSQTDGPDQFITVEEERPINLTQSVENILSKALKAGIENLNYKELSDLHKKTIKAATVLGKPLKESEAVDETPAPARDRLCLMRRIANLEADLMKKQLHAHKKLQSLEESMKSEKVLLGETKNALLLERRRNIELAQRIGVQTKEVASIAVERDFLKRRTSFHEDRLQELIVAIEEEKAKGRSLEEELEKARNAGTHLRHLVDTEKERAKSIKTKANETIEIMRRRLEQSLDTETELRGQLHHVMPQPSHYTRHPGQCPLGGPCSSGYSPDRRGRDSSVQYSQRR